MAESSFDIVSEFDRQELVNAIDQAARELRTRYDLKDTGSTIDLNEHDITLTTDNEMSLRSVRDILHSKMVRRDLALKILNYDPVENISGGRVRQIGRLQQGISAELAKKIQKMVRDEFKKVQARIQGDAIRVGSKSKDDLQHVIAFLRTHEEELPVPLQFINYR